MAKEHICTKCNKSFSTKTELKRHVDRRFPCDTGKFKCQKCNQTFQNRNGRDHHRKHTCKGPVQTTADLQAQVAQLQTVLAATGALGEHRRQHTIGPSTTSVQADTVNIQAVSGDVVIEGDKISNIYNNTNVFVLPMGEEDSEHIKRMSFEELKSEIGLQPNATTMKKLFRLRRLDQNHPENITLLLPDRDGDQLHYKTEKGWETGEFYNIMHAAWCQDSSFLDRIYPDDLRFDAFHGGFLIYQHMQKTSSSPKDRSLKPESDELRPDIFRLTQDLAEKYTPEQSAETNVRDGKQASTLQTSAPVLRLELEVEQARIRRLELELELEVLRKRDAQVLELNDASRSLEVDINE